MSLAIQARNGAALPAPGMSPASSPVMTLQDVWQMAEHIAASNLFATKTPEQAFALMMLAQSEGLHPMQAVRRFHIVQGRPVMRSDAAQAEFQRQGGRIKPLKRDAREARAVFSHPELMPDGFEIGVTFEQYKAAGLTGKDVWKNFPDDMLWARLVTKGVRTVMPGIIAGIYSAEETDDILTIESPAGRHEASRVQAAAAIAESDDHVYGWDHSVPDTRPYHLVVADAVEFTNRSIRGSWTAAQDPPPPLDARKIHGLIAARAVIVGNAEGPAPTKVQAAVAFTTKVYGEHRQWVRRELVAMCDQHVDEAAEALAAIRAQADQEEAPASPDDPDPDFDFPAEPGEGG